MSFSADFADQDRQRLLSDSEYAGPYEPGFFEGSLIGAAGRSIISGATQMALQAAQYGNDPDQAFLLNVPTDEEEVARRAAIGLQRLDFAKSIRPSADTNGKAAQVIFDLGDNLTRFGIGMASGGLPVGALTVGASTGEQQYLTLRDQGVDWETAAKAGILQGATGTAMAFLPAARFVKPLLGDAAIAVGAGVGIGAASRGSTAALLERAGYADQAKQFAAFDRDALLTDGILGLAFFGLGRAATRGVVEPTPEQVDAALTANNSRSHIVDTAPGAPVDLPSEINHQRLMDHVADQLNRGEEVTVPEWYRGEFLVRDEMEPLQMPRETMEALAAEEVVPAFTARANQDLAGAVPNVRDLRTELGNLNRSLGDLQRQFDSAGDSFRSAAKEFQQQRMTRKQAERAARDSIAQQRQAIDEQRAATQARIDELNQKLDGNRAAERARGELSAMKRGEAPKRLREEISARADQMTALRREIATANRTPIEQRVDTSISEIMDEVGLGRDADDVLAPRTPAVDSAPTGETQQSRAPQETQQGENGGPAPTGKAADLATRPSREQPVSDLDLAREATLRRPDTMVNSGFDADGNALQSRAADVMAGIEAEHQAGVKDAQSYMAAIKCLLAG
ncbi:hypothetical protein [Pseudomonas juntendi]|uniref:hypothetical protein n=1 Tax=Pseudomonas juntendi TaxID=2666183 RepID=UPI00244A05CC|nr:hypothetical protein [Pseudomonas juntendi]MDH0042460.1 hypothetical protein [Pseudomonas juntendi]